MAQEINSDEDEQAQDIHHRLEQTRLGLSEKVEALQDRMKETVDSTRQTVEDAMHSVKQTVQDTIHSIKQTFDVKYQTQRHPWLMVAGAACAGLVLAHLTSKRPSRRRQKDDVDAGEQMAHLSSRSGGPARSTYEPARRERMEDADREQPASSKSNFKQRLSTQFHDEISKLQAVAIGVGAGMLRDWLKRAMPSVASKVEEVFDSATSKMGGEPVKGPVFSRSTDGHGHNV